MCKGFLLSAHADIGGGVAIQAVIICTSQAANDRIKTSIRRKIGNYSGEIMSGFDTVSIYLSVFSTDSNRDGISGDGEIIMSFI